MKYLTNGIPVGTGIALMRELSRSTDSGENTDSRNIRLKIDATLRDADGNYIADAVQRGFSELSVAKGGKIYEY